MGLAFILQSLSHHAADADQIGRLTMAFFTLMPILMLVGLAVIIIPFWFICKKAGFSPWLSMINIIPFGNLILIYVLAFSDWKTQATATGSPVPFPLAQTPPR